MTDEEIKETLRAIRRDVRSTSENTNEKLDAAIVSVTRLAKALEADDDRLRDRHRDVMDGLRDVKDRIEALGSAQRREPTGRFPIAPPEDDSLEIGPVKIPQSWFIRVLKPAIPWLVLGILLGFAAVVIALRASGAKISVTESNSATPELPAPPKETAGP